MVGRLLWLLPPAVVVVVINAAEYTKPRQCGGTVRHVRLAAGVDAATSMIVSFASIPSNYEAPIGGVLIGKSPSAMNDFVLQTDDSPTSYNVTLDRPIGNYDEKRVYVSPFYHHVVLEGLEPATTYYYRPVVEATSAALVKKYNLRIEAVERIHEEEHAGDQERDAGRRQLLEDERETARRRLGSPAYDGTDKECPSPDKIRSFTTAPAAGEFWADRSVNIAIMGDLGQYEHSEETMERMLLSRSEIDSVILAGDLAYPRSDHQQWDTFLDFLEDFPVAERVGMQIACGNHDIDKQNHGTEIFLAYETRFRMARVHPPLLGEIGREPISLDHPQYPLPYEWGNGYYAYTFGPARFVVVNAYASMEPNSTQYQWIKGELETVDRSFTPWLFAVIHVPIYNTFGIHLQDPQIFAAKEHLEPLFVQHKVNMVFNGHIHAYLRTANVAADELHPQGPMHVTVGAAGRQCEAPFKNEEPEEWVAVRDATIYGYGMLRLHNRSVAEWDWVHTGYADHLNAVYHSNTTLPAGPGRDQVFIQNQYFL